MTSGRIYQAEDRRSWYRIDPEGRPVWLAGPDDVSGEQHPYDPSCPACWLGHGHTTAAHRAAVDA